MEYQSPTHELAFFLYSEIQGHDCTYGEAFQDIMFKRRCLSHSKHVLKQGAEMKVIKRALLLMKQDGVDVYSPQQAIDWTRRSSGKPYYVEAKEIIDEENKQPPKWDSWKYLMWLHRSGNHNEIKERLHGRKLR